MNETPVLIRKLTPTGFQELNRRIYLQQNDRNYPTTYMVSRLHRYATRILKAVRKDDVGKTPYHLSMAFSWSTALANRYHVDLGEEMWKRFPGVCPYCTDAPCSCKERLDRRSRIEDITGQKPETMVEFQMMFRRIYPANTIRDSAMHLAEEVGELDEAIEHYAGTHQGNLFEEIVIELVDEITNICAVASCLNVDLAFAMEQNFAHGCPKCVGTPCTCGYTGSKVM